MEERLVTLLHGCVSWFLYSANGTKSRNASLDIETISTEARKIPVLAFVPFIRAPIGALRKKLLEQFTVIFSILNDIFV